MTFAFSSRLTFWYSMFARFLVLIAGLSLFVGCNSDTTPSSSVVSEVGTSGDAGPVVGSTPADPKEAVAAIEAVTKKVRRDSAGFIIDVDFRDLVISDSDLIPLTELKRLRAVRLGGTAVTDEALKTIGQLSNLEDLDLRECGISDDGLAALSQLNKLKALRLSGKSGACSVSDDGMVHVAKLKNLKVLAIDYLWVSEDGVNAFLGLDNLQELYMAETTIGNESVELFAKFPNLKKLRLARNQIDATGVANLPKIQLLEELDLSECAQLFDDAMGPLAELKNLKKLILWRVNISDVGVSDVPAPRQEHDFPGLRGVQIRA